MGVYNCSEGAIVLRYYMKRKLTEPWHMYGSTFVAIAASNSAILENNCAGSTRKLHHFNSKGNRSTSNEMVPSYIPKIETLHLFFQF